MIELGAGHRDEQPAQLAIKLSDGIVQPRRHTARLAHGGASSAKRPGLQGAHVGVELIDEDDAVNATASAASIAAARLRRLP